MVGTECRFLLNIKSKIYCRTWHAGAPSAYVLIKTSLRLLESQTVGRLRLFTSIYTSQLGPDLVQDLVQAFYEEHVCD